MGDDSGIGCALAVILIILAFAIVLIAVPGGEIAYMGGL
jgi:hypothetical protein